MGREVQDVAAVHDVESERGVLVASTTQPDQNQPVRIVLIRADGRLVPNRHRIDGSLRDPGDQRVSSVSVTGRGWLNSVLTVISKIRPSGLAGRNQHCCQQGERDRRPEGRS